MLTRLEPASATPSAVSANDPIQQVLANAGATGTFATKHVVEADDLRVTVTGVGAIRVPRNRRDRLAAGHHGGLVGMDPPVARPRSGYRAGDRSVGRRSGEAPRSALDLRAELLAPGSMLVRDAFRVADVDAR